MVSTVVRGVLVFHAAVAALLGLGALLALGSGAIELPWPRVGGHLVTFVAAAALASLIVLAGRRPTADDLALAAAASLVFINAMVLSYAPFLVAGFPQVGSLNWSGKGLSLAYVLMAIAQQPAGVRRNSGLLGLPAREHRRFTVLMLGLFALLGLVLAWADSGAGDPVEATLFQLTLPSLSEELLFRAVLLSLLGAVGLRALPGLPQGFGRAAIATSLLFGLVHGFLFLPDSGFVVQPVPIVATGLLGAGLAWLTIRCRSVWPAVVAHSLLNATGPMLRLIGLL